MYGPLTDDHVPPKGTLKVSQVDLLHIIDYLSTDRPKGKIKYRHCQNGVSFRSLCATCNSGLLGAKYDPALLHFANSVTVFLKSRIHHPQRPKITIQPGFVARAVIGHLFAVGLERTERTPLLTAAADFILNDTLSLPDDINVHYWVYPYRNQVALRDATLLTDFFGSPPIVFWCLKFFPLGFMVTWANKQTHKIPHPSLRDYMINAGSHSADVPLYLDRIPSERWPEAPGNTEAVMLGDAAIGAIPRVHK